MLSCLMLMQVTALPMLLPSAPSPPPLPVTQRPLLLPLLLSGMQMLSRPRPLPCLMLMQVAAPAMPLPSAPSPPPLPVTQRPLLLLLLLSVMPMPSCLR